MPKRKQKPKQILVQRCKSWPNCACIVQGYVNAREDGSCGRKPTRQQDAKVYHG